MKHFTLLFAFLGLFSWQANAQCTGIVPNYSQAFATFPPDVCWTEATDGTIATGPTSLGSGNWAAGTAIGNTARINLYSNFVSDWTLSPTFDLSGGGYEVVLEVAVTDWNGSTPDVMGSDDVITLAYTEDGINWTGLMSWSAADALTPTLTPFIMALPTTGANVQFGILASDGTVNDVEDYDFHFDNFEVRTPPACPNVSALTAMNITATTADLAWTDATNSLWNVEWGPTGFTPGTGTMITGTTNNPEGISGLTAATQYDFYVQSDCGGGNTGSWVGPMTFSTTFNTPVGVTCGAGFATMVFSDDMETAIGWTGNIGTAAGQWDYPTAAPGGNSSSTGPSGPASGTTYAEYEASGSQALASMVTPMIDLSSGSSMAELSFYMHAYGSEIGTLNVGVGTSPGGPFTTEFSWTGQYQTSAAQAWEHIGVDITAYLGQQIYIEFSYAAAGPNFYGDLAIDLVQVETCVTCPAPTGLGLVIADLTSAEFDWTENGSATEWELEWGTTGFAPGTGTTLITTENPDTLTGLAPNTFFEVYVQSVCGVGDTSAIAGPVSFNTYNLGQYMENDTECGPGFIDISSTGTPAGLLYAGEMDMAMPFDFYYQGTLVQNIALTSSGYIMLEAAPGQFSATFNQTINNAIYYGLFPFWEAIEADFGDQYTEVIGTAPNRTFIVQWENNNYVNGPNTETVTFQLQCEEATGEIYFIYDDMVFGGSDAFQDNGNSATIGVNGPAQNIQVSYNNPTFLENNSCSHFYYTDCPKPTNYAVTYTTEDEAAITWGAGLAGETDWTVIYGPAGFDPGMSGTSVTTSTPALIMPGLDDITCYDVYIYADCNPMLQSNGYMGTFCTLPNCANPSGIATSTAVDTVMSSWAWTENVGYPSTGFGIQYGWSGFMPGTGTVAYVDNNFTDTTEDFNLIGGGIYDIYVQAVCGTDSSAWIGPVPFTMPLSNDSTCFAEELAVDGTVYTFSNVGATIDANEGTIAPPATGCNTQDGWCNSNINFTTWFTFIAPASGNVRLDGSDQGYDGQIAVYEVADCNDFATYTLLGANDDGGTGLSPMVNLCGLTPGNTYYLMHDSYSTGSGGTYSLKLDEIAVEAGTDNGLVDICLGDTADLFNNITGYDMGGTWNELIPTANFNDPYFVSAGLASQVFDFEYVVIDGCATDTVATSVEIYAPSSAGIDGTIDACMNQPLNLLSGLSGNVDLNGAWYDPSNSLLADGDIVSSSIPGQFNYDYITGNGVCPDDTANVIVDVDFNCDYLNLQEMYFNAMDIHPNPTTGMIYISNNGSDEVFNIEVTDLNGKVISSQNGAINGTETTEVSLGNLETGIYLIRVFNDNAEKTYRIVKQ